MLSVEEFGYHFRTRQSPIEVDQGQVFLVGFLKQFAEQLVQAI